jgi:hypothetical protein
MWSGGGRTPIALLPDFLPGIVVRSARVKYTQKILQQCDIADSRAQLKYLR